MALFGRPTPRNDAKAMAYAQWVQQRNPWAIASLVLGVFSFIEMGVLLVLGIAGIVTGIIALRQLSLPTDNRPYGKRLAWTGIALSVTSLACAVVLYLRVLG